MSYFQRLVVNTLTFISLTVLLPNMIHVRSLMMAVVASVVLSVLNALIKPILTILSFPITLLTFGLFTFIINGFILKMTSNFVGEQHFGFSSFGAAIIVSMILSFVNMIVTEHNMDKMERRKN